MTIAKLQKLTSVCLVCFRIVLLDECSCATHEEQFHQVTPVLGICALLKCTDATNEHLIMLHDEVALTAYALDVLLRTYSEVKVWVEEQLQLITNVREVLIVRRSREEQNLAIHLCDKVTYVVVASTIRVTQVVTFIYDDKTVVFHVVHVQLLLHTRHVSLEVVCLDVLMPHLLKVGRADDKRACIILLLKHLGNGTCRDGLTKTYHVTNHGTATLLIIKVLGCYLDRCLLKLKEVFLEHRRQGVFSNTATCILRKHVGSL